MQASFRARLAAGPPLLLDGATGTELNRRGVDTALPLWSARALLEAPDELLAVHRDYVAAGADIITTNTFRTHGHSLAAAGMADRAAELTCQAVEIARQAVAGTDCLVAGSVAPLEDCYSPGLVPEDAALETEHAAMVEALCAAGVDVLLVETMNTVREAAAAARAAVGTGKPTIVSFVCGRDGRLLSGESVRDAATEIAALKAAVLAVNCSSAPDLLIALTELSTAVALPLGAYGNVGYADDEQGWVNTDSVEPEVYAKYAADWLRLGACLVGSCCGTGPAHTWALRELIDADR